MDFAKSVTQLDLLVTSVYLEEVLRASLCAQPEDVFALGVVLGHLDHARVGEREGRLLQLRVRLRRTLVAVHEEGVGPQHHVHRLPRSVGRLLRENVKLVQAFTDLEAMDFNGIGEQKCNKYVGKLVA